MKEAPHQASAAPPRDGRTPPGWVGTPEQVADDLLKWVDEQACDGFNFNIDRFVDASHLVDWLVPELQQRGRFRKEYESTTFRGNLGLA